MIVVASFKSNLFDNLTDEVDDHDPIAISGRGVNRDQVVVVEVDAPGAELRKTMYGGNWIERGPDEFTEGVAAAVADRPEAEGEFVVARGRIGHMRQPSNQERRLNENGALSNGLSRSLRKHECV